MSFLSALGIDFSLVLHLGIFLASFICLYIGVTGPYFRAFQKRQQLSSPAESAQVEKEVQDLEKAFGEKARDLNAKIDKVFAEKESSAQKKATELSKQKSKQLDEKVNTWYRDLEKESSLVKNDIQNQSEDLKTLFVDTLIKN